MDGHERHRRHIRQLRDVVFVISLLGFRSLVNVRVLSADYPRIGRLKRFHSQRQTRRRFLRLRNRHHFGSRQGQHTMYHCSFLDAFAVELSASPTTAMTTPLTLLRLRDLGPLKRLFAYVFTLCTALLRDPDNTLGVLAFSTTTSSSGRNPPSTICLTPSCP